MLHVSHYCWVSCASPGIHSWVSPNLPQEGLHSVLSMSPFDLTILARCPVAAAPIQLLSHLKHVPYVSKCWKPSTQAPVMTGVLPLSCQPNWSKYLWLLSSVLSSSHPLETWVYMEGWKRDEFASVAAAADWSLQKADTEAFLSDA
jgi:hypothetical protein